MATTAYITKEPDILHGKPHIHGTRVGVRQVVELDAEGWEPDAIAEEFGVSTDAVEAALAYAEDHPAEMDRLETQQAERVDEIRAAARGPE